MAKISIASPMSTSLDVMADIFEGRGWLRNYFSLSRKPPHGVTAGHVRRNLPLTLLRSANERWTRTTRRRLEIRYSLMRPYDAWVRKQLVPGDWLGSSFGFVVDSFRAVKAAGGVTFIDGGNSHPESFWSLVQEEHERWGWHEDPIPRSHHDRVMAMLEHTDYIFCPSGFVRDSYLARGFAPERLPLTGYRVQLDSFRPAAQRPPARPFRVLSTGDCCLRKGTPYLLEAAAQLRRENIPVELVLPRRISDDVRKLAESYAAQIRWYDYMPHASLPRLLNSCHAFVLPSVEEGLARAGIEAMACGLPVIATRNTGLSDFIRDGVNGFLVPVRDSAAIAGALRKLFEDPALAESLGGAARQSVAVLGPETYAERLVNVVEEIAANAAVKR